MTQIRTNNTLSQRPAMPIDDGTLNRQPTQTPGVAGLGKLRARRDRGLRRLRILQRGARGPLVVKLQRLLNVRLDPGPGLKLDGRFGIRTFAAVYVFQRGRGIERNGIVDSLTWAHLLGGHIVKVPPVPIKGLSTPLPDPALVPIPGSLKQDFRRNPGDFPEAIRITVWEWPLHRKVGTMLTLVPSRVPSALWQQIRSAISTDSLVLTVGLVCAVSGIGEAAAIPLLAGLGLDLHFRLFLSLYMTAYAASMHDLEEAADEMANFVILAGAAAATAAIQGARAQGAEATRGKGPAPTEASPAETSWRPRGLIEEIRPLSPVPTTPTLLRLKALPRSELIKVIRRELQNKLVPTKPELTIYDESRLVLWEDIEFGAFYKPVRAGTAAEALGVRPNDVVAYVVEKPPSPGSTSAVFGLENVETTISPYGDPFYGYAPAPPPSYMPAAPQAPK
ncbi:MAG TPA: peptidoglycan-binding domain-containing protein [Verrucomicrobiae bacterium]